MLQILINFVFSILSSVASIIFYPIQAILNAFVPDIGNTVSFITTFIGYALLVVPTAFYMFCVPENATAIFFTYILGKYTLYLSYVAIKFLIKAYNKLKP